MFLIGLIKGMSDWIWSRITIEIGDFGNWRTQLRRCKKLLYVKEVLNQFIIFEILKIWSFSRNSQVHKIPKISPEFNQTLNTSYKSSQLACSSFKIIDHNQTRNQSTTNY